MGASLPTCTPLPCTFALPNALGVTHDCQGKRTAETCSATCGVAARPFSGYSMLYVSIRTGSLIEAGFQYAAGAAAATFTCQPSGSFSGTSPNCSLAASGAPCCLRRTHPMPRPTACDQLLTQLPRRGSRGCICFVPGRIYQDSCEVACAAGSSASSFHPSCQATPCRAPLAGENVRQSRVFLG